MNILELFSEIKYFIFDMDGVLTDGKLYLSPGAEPGRTSHMKDGYAIQKAASGGYTIIILSGAESIMYSSRLEKLGVQHIYMGVRDKHDRLLQISDTGICDLGAALYMGDDTPDKEAMSLCLLSAAPHDAVADIQMTARYISPYAGGEGCVRDVIEKVLRSRGDW